MNVEFFPNLYTNGMLKNFFYSIYELQIKEKNTQHVTKFTDEKKVRTHITYSNGEGNFVTENVYESQKKGQKPPIKRIAAERTTRERERMK